MQPADQTAGRENSSDEHDNGVSLPVKALTPAQIEAHRRMASQRGFTKRLVPWQHNGGRPIVLQRSPN